MKHPEMRRWDATLKTLFDEIDDCLEDRWGDRYSLHPNRPKRGETANKEMDGLFNVGADFSTGYGSRLGRGYVVSIRMSTLDWVPDDVRQMMRAEVQSLVEEKIEAYFPGRHLRVEQDGSLLKIIGDFSLGSSLVE